MPENPLDVLAKVECPHARHLSMCTPCAADAVRPELERLRAEADRLDQLLIDERAVTREQQLRAQKAEADLERVNRGNRMINLSARDQRHRADRAERDLQQLRGEHEVLTRRLAHYRPTAPREEP